MLSEKVLTAINEQINHELFSAYLYLSMSAYFEASSLPGFAKWTRMQAQEETEHALKFFDYIADRGGRIELQAIDKPQKEWGSALEAFKAVLEHEQKVASLINKLYATAVVEKDYATEVLLHWFISEQVEEEKNATAIVDQLQMMEEHKAAIINIDHHVGKRE